MISKNKEPQKKEEIVSGLEIHQQLNTGKLFCRCPSYLRSDVPDYSISRRLHAVPGESGEVDIAARHQASLKKEFIYQGYCDSNCLIELDEEPPKEINSQSLNIALQIALLLNCEILPVTQIMRKTVIDGSNTSGFQRTVLIAQGGFIETSKGRVGIDSVCLEEDAARIISREEGKEVYRLDRLGIPLIEIATSPDIKDSEQAKEVALKIGDVLRSCNVKRGLGTIRQDVNLSIPKEGGERVEVKGMQDMKSFLDVLDNEIGRQKALLKIKDELPKFNDSEIIDLSKDVSSGKEWIKNSLSQKKKIFGFKILGFRGYLGKELVPGFWLGKELADYAKLRRFKGIIHSDEDLVEKYGFSKKDIENIDSKLKIKNNDSFILVIGEKNKVLSLIHDLLFPRLRNVFKGVPKEVRNALQKDGRTVFLRPMPGAERMYPETDLPLLKISRDRINLVKKDLPKLRSQIKKELEKEGLSSEMIKLLFKKNRILDFKEMLSVLNSPQFVAKVLLLWPTEIAKHNNLSEKTVYEKLNKDILGSVLEKVSEKKLDKNDVREALERIISGKSFKEAIKFEKIDESKLEEYIVQIVKGNPGLNPNAYMGMIMKKPEFRGKVDGKRVMGLIQKYV